MSLATSPETLGGLARELFRNKRPRTGQRVRRESYAVGEREVRQWRQHNTFADSEHNARMRAAEALERATRKPGRRNGALGHIALEVYRFLLRTRKRQNGRLDWSYGQIASELGRSRSAVGSALAALKARGFLDWIRRTQQVDDPEPGGQHTEQISNAFLLSLRKGAAVLVGALQRRPTDAQREAAATKARFEHAASATEDELLADIGDPQLREVVERTLRSLKGANPH